MSAPPRWPVEPLLALTGLTVSQLTHRHGISGTTARQGLTEAAAERIAVAHNLHPYLVWPAMADAAIESISRRCADDKCGQVFIPERSNQRYCTARCRTRARARRRARRRYHVDLEYRARRIAAARAYRADIGHEAVNAAEHRRYWVDPEPRRAARRARYHRTRKAA